MPIATPSSASIIAVLTVRDGKIVRWREDQGTLGMALALGQLPGLLTSMSSG